MYQTHNPNNDSNCQPTHATAAPGGRTGQGCIKLLDFSLSSIGWRRGLGRGGASLLVSPLLGPLPTRSSRGEDGELDAALTASGRRISSFGRQHFNNPKTASMELIDATISTSHGPCRLATRHWGTANATPATSAAGQTPSIPRNPANVQTTQNGTRSEKNGSCLPTIAESALTSRPVTALNARIGVPKAPNATGAVL